MPISIPAPHTLDVANMASKLPRPLQWAGGAALEGLKQLTGVDDPNSIMGVGMPMEGAAPPVKKITDELHPAIQLLLSHLEAPPESTLDPAKVFLNEKVGSHMIPGPTQVMGHEVGRNPALEALYKSQQDFYGNLPKAAPISTRKKLTGTVPGSAKLSADDVRAIRALRDGGAAPKDIFDQYSQHNTNTLRSVLNDQTWNNVK